MKLIYFINIFLLFSFLACSNKALRTEAIDIEGNRYSISIASSKDIFIKPQYIEAGESLSFQLFTPSRVRIEGVSTSDQLLLKAHWSIEPNDDEVVLNSKTGQFKTSKSIRGNRSYTISAKINGLKEPIRHKILVYSKKDNPLIGHWHEKGVKDVFNELIFQPNGHFSFTTIPFESYKDYWGEYEIDDNNRVKMRITGGNNQPKDAKLDKVVFSINEKGELILRNFYYGTLKKDFREKEETVFIH